MSLRIVPTSSRSYPRLTKASRLFAPPHIGFSKLIRLIIAISVGEAFLPKTMQNTPNSIVNSNEATGSRKIMVILQAQEDPEIVFTLRVHKGSLNDGS